jgi:PQQ-like domain
LPARLALPALLANAQHNQQINSELNGENEQRNQTSQRVQSASPQRLEKFENFTLVPDGDKYVEFASRMVEQHFVTREAIEASSKDSALDSGKVSVMNETAAVNEQLNDIQRTTGGDKVTEDQSRYEVSIRRPDSSQVDWTGEVIGPPQFFPLKTVNVLAAGKTIIVFDKSNKKLWQAELTYNVTGGNGETYQSRFGEGPCVENGDTLYVFDQAVLTAYDPTTGYARWRIPSVGVVGLFFDNDGMVYVNTTTGNPDNIKYSRQIDITDQTKTVVLKVDPKNGTILWRIKPGGFVSYLSGQFLYTVQSFDPGDQEDVLNDTMVGLEKPPLLRIKRINPQNGREMWDYEEGRAPVNIRFNHNSIEIVLKKEVEVLRFFSL